MSAPLSYPIFRAWDDDGIPLDGGKVYTYEPNSSTPKVTYSNYNFATPNDNPVVLDTNGEAVIYLNGVYKIILKDSDDVTLWTQDYVGDSPVSTSSDQNVGGVKTFSSFPILPSSSPTTNYQAVHRKWVVDNYEESANRNAASGYCPLDAATLVPTANLGTGSATNATFLRGDQTYATSASPTIILQHRESNNNNGGGQNAGSWTTRTLNTEVLDTDTLCSLATNIFTIETGTYEIDCTASFYACGASQIRLYNVSDTVVQNSTTGYTLYGAASYLVGNVFGITRLVGRFNILAQKQFRIESRVSASNTSNGWGVACNFGNDEIYLNLILKKVS